MKNRCRFFLVTVLLAILSTTLYSQEKEISFKPTGQLYGKVFSNFHYQFSEEHESAFAVERAYIGYEQLLSENFTINLKLDIGSPNQESSYDIIKRYAYFKNAALEYTKNQVTIRFGLIDLFQFKIQEKFWSHRYIYRSFMDEHKFGASADLGASVTYMLNDKISTDLTVMNGEGYNQLQADNAYKTGFGITFLPIKGLTTRFYIDYTEQQTIQTTWTGFVGYQLKGLGKIGAEYNYQANNKYNLNYDLHGFSTYAAYNVFDKWELFARYDKLWSNTLEGDQYQWNINKDGSALIAGIQFEPIKSIKIAANYQDWYPYAKNLENESYFYLNVEYKF